MPQIRPSSRPSDRRNGPPGRRRSAALAAVVGLTVSLTTLAAPTAAAVTAEDVVTVLTTGGEVTLDADLTVPGMIHVPEGVSASLDLNGHTLTVAGPSGPQELSAFGRSALIVSGEVFVSEGSLVLTGGPGMDDLPVRPDGEADQDAVGGLGLYVLGGLLLRSVDLHAIGGDGGAGRAPDGDVPGGRGGDGMYAMYSYGSVVAIGSTLTTTAGTPGPGTPPGRQLEPAVLGPVLLLNAHTGDPADETLVHTYDPARVVAMVAGRWPQRAHHEFLGWFTAPEGGEPVRFDEGRPSELHAQWLALPPTWQTSQLPALTVGQPVDLALVTTGAGEPAFAVVAGQLPAGLELAADGRVSGTPTAAGAYDLTVRVTAVGGSADQRFSGSVARGSVAVQAADVHSRVDEPATFVVTGLPGDAEGTVTFQRGEQIVCSYAVAVADDCVAVGAEAGTFPLTVEYSGDARYDPATAALTWSVEDQVPPAPPAEIRGATTCLGGIPALTVRLRTAGPDRQTLTIDTPVGVKVFPDVAPKTLVAATFRLPDGAGSSGSYTVTSTDVGTGAVLGVTSVDFDLPACTR